MSKPQCVHLFDCVEKDGERCPNDVYKNTSYCEVHQKSIKQDEEKKKRIKENYDEILRRVQNYLNQ